MQQGLKENALKNLIALEQGNVVNVEMVGDASLNHTKSMLEVTDTDRCNQGKQGLNGENSKLVIKPGSEVEEGEILASVCSDKTKEMLVIEEVFDFVVEGG